MNNSSVYRVRQLCGVINSYIYRGNLMYLQTSAHKYMAISSFYRVGHICIKIDSYIYKVKQFVVRLTHL